MPARPRPLIRMSPPVGDCDLFQKMRSHEEIGNTDEFAQRFERVLKLGKDRFSSAAVRAVPAQYWTKGVAGTWWRRRDE